MNVDIAKVLYSKKPHLSPWIAKPLIAYLRRVVHEQEINSYLIDFETLSPIEFVRASLDRMQIRYSCPGLDRLDPNGRYLFASNHPFGGLDGLMLASEVYRRFGDAKLVVNDLLMNVKPLAPLFIPINKHGLQNPQYARNYYASFSSNVPIITFPAGLCSRKIGGKIVDLAWKPSFVKNALSSGRDIVPVYFDGKLSKFFYGLYRLRTTLGVKANIEMLYLVDEMFKQKGQSFEILVGEPIRCDQLRNGMSASEWAIAIRRNAYNLKKK